MYIEQYIREIIREEVNYNTQKAITEILVYNRYDTYNMLDESLKLKVKNILQKAIIFGVAGMSGLGGYAASGRSATDDTRAAYNKAIELVQGKSSEEIIDASIKVLTTGEYSANKSLPQNIKKQLAIIMTHRNPQEDGKFIVVDDQNKLLYLFNQQGKVIFKSPVITGRDLDKNLNRKISFANWLLEKGKVGDYQEVRNSNKKSDKKIEKKLFFGYLKYMADHGQKITPGGLYSISAIKQVGKKGYDQDRVAYGNVGKVSIEPGMDSPLSAETGIAIHGTGIKGRMEAFRKAIRYMKKAGDKADPAKVAKILSGVNSYGCINLPDSYLKKLMKLITTNTTLYVMSDAGDGVIQFASRGVENIGAMLDYFVVKAGRVLSKATGLYYQYVKSQPQLEVKQDKFELQ